jgi:hypothetical protein
MLGNFLKSYILLNFKSILKITAAICVQFRGAGGVKALKLNDVESNRLCNKHPGKVPF